MSGWGWDDELPAGFQEADYDARELESLAADVAALRARGICAHGWVQGSGPVRCLENGCGQTWPTQDAWYQARAEVLA